MSNTSTSADGVTVIALANGFKAELLVHGAMTPRHFGARPNTAIDSTAALQLWIDTLFANGGASVGAVYPRVDLDFGHGVYYVTSGLTLSGRTNVVLRNGHLIATGTLWTAGGCMLTIDTPWSSILQMTIDCNKRANGVKDTAGRTRFEDLRIFRMSPDWVSYGLFKPNEGSGDVRLSRAWISQWVTSDPEFSDPANFTAIGIHIAHSDCKIHDSNINWCGVCFKGDNGVHLIYNTHLVNGRTGLAETNPRLIEWAKDGTGELSLLNCYLDNGKCDFYNDRVNLDVICLSDTADSVLTDGMLRFHAQAGSTALRANGTIRFVQWNSTYDILRLKNYDGNVWDADQIALAEVVNERINEATVQNMTVHLNRRALHASFSSSVQGEAFFGNHGIGFNGPGITLGGQAAEPTMLPNGSLARSDGTASTNGFGAGGAGVYEKTGGAWARIS